MPDSDYLHFFTGSIVEVLALKQALSEKKIFPIIKDESESARLAGFGISNPTVQQVFLHKAMPQGFMQSESINLRETSFHQNDGTIHAKEIQLKCPSKYNEQNHIVSE